MILNLTQHTATNDQLDAGVYDLAGTLHEMVKTLLTFEKVPTRLDITARALALAEVAVEVRKDRHYEKVMIGGAPWLMSSLEKALFESGFTPVYAFSKRVSTEEFVDGNLVKKQVFKHLGFFEQTDITDDAEIL